METQSEIFYKECSKCGDIVETKIGFYRNKKSNDGYSTICKVCMDGSDKRYKQSNREIINTYNREFYKRNEFQSIRKLERVQRPEFVVWRNARDRAKKDNIEFSIKVEDIGLMPDYCPYLGIKIMVGINPIKRGEAHPQTPSLDRIDTTKGYIPGNVIVCSWRANKLKNNGLLEELILLGKNLERLYKNSISYEDNGI